MTARYSSREWVELIVVGAVALSAMVLADTAGYAQKWQGSASATVAVFGILLTEFRHAWRKFWLWISLAVLAACHIVATWLVIGIAFAGTTHIGYLYSLAAAVAEVVVFYVLLRAVEQRTQRLT